ncbi:MAG: GNAT family N-acetyltransferase [Ignavibacteriaceae bacterium]
MFELKTERLRILPLNIDQVKLLKDNPAQLEENLFLNESHKEKYDDIMEKEIGEVFETVIKKMGQNPFNYTWFTMWQIISKEENKIIGLCGFNGMPDMNGEVEIGYALKPNYQKRGYMPEVMKEFMRYAFMHAKVKALRAQTPTDYISSQKILIEFGFKKASEVEGIITWKLGNPNLKT